MVVSKMVKNAIREVRQIAKRIADLQRDEAFTLIFQEYEEIVTCESVEIVADSAISYREEISALDERSLAINVVHPDFLVQRERERHEKAAVSPCPEEQDGDTQELVKELFEMDVLMEHTWGIVLLVSLKLHPEEDEHHEEIVSTFERLFQRYSPYLHALAQNASCILDTISFYKLHHCDLCVDVFVAALHKDNPKSSEELQAVVELMVSLNIPVTVAVADLLQKAFVRCMKTEGEEFVYLRMVEDCGLPPLSSRPFAMVFNSKRPLQKASSVIDYYEQMLDYGIKPEDSVLRILCNKCKNENEYALKHFTLLSKLSNSSNADTKDDDSSVQDSRRRNPLSFFQTRLEKLLMEPNSGQRTHLLEAMKVLHRIEVEGLSLKGDVFIIETLLLHFCNGTTPAEDLVQPFYLSKAYSAKKVELPTPEGEDDARHDRKKEIIQENAFDFNLTDDVAELLEGDDDGGSSLEGSFSPEDHSLSATQNNAGEEIHRGTNSRESRHHHPGTATVVEEVEYVLRVMESFGWTISERLLMIIHAALYNYRNFEHRLLEVMGVLIFHQFEVNRQLKNVANPFPCYVCLDLIEYYSKQHQRQRISDLLREIALQYYTFVGEFNQPWDLQKAEYLPKVEVKPVNNDRALRTLISIAVRAVRNVDWCLGLFALGLITTECQVANQLRKRIVSFITDAPPSAPYVRVITEIQRCEWEREQIFASKLLMYGIAESDPNTSPSKQQSTYGVDGGEGSDGAPSEYSTSRRMEERRTLDDYLHIALRDIKLDRPVIEWYRKRLMAHAPPRS